MTWGWVKPLLWALGKLLGAGFLIRHGKQSAKKEELEADVKAHKKINDIVSSPDVDDPANGL